MNVQRPQNDIVEIFGYAPNDTSTVCRSLWTLGACPFVETPCSKSNHDKTIVYGTCSVTTRFGDALFAPIVCMQITLPLLKKYQQMLLGTFHFILTRNTSSIEVTQLLVLLL